MRRKRVIRKAFATLSVFLALLLACGIAFPSQARAEEAEIETRPTVHNAVVLVLDDSGSMWGKPIDKLKEAAKKFSEKILEADTGAKIAIVSFSNSTKVLPFTNNRISIDVFVEEQMHDLGNGTYVAPGLMAARSQVQSFTVSDTVSDKYIKSIITMSDGIPHDGSSATQLAQSMFPDYNMYSVGFFKDGDNAEAIEFLKSIQNSGYFEANDLDALIKKFLEIADELLNPVEISLSHDYTKKDANGNLDPTNMRSFTLRAEIKNPNSQKMIRNLKATLKLPEGLTLQEGKLEKTWDKLVAGQTEKLEWKVRASDSASGALVYSVTVSGVKIIELTQSDKITLDTQNGKDNQLIFSRDTWSFANTKDNFKNKYFLNDKDKEALRNGLEKSEKAQIDTEREKEFGGSCYGFAVSSVLNKMGIASPLQRQREPRPECLHDLDSSDDIQSYINYYQLSLHLPGVYKNIEQSYKRDIKELGTRIKAVSKGKSPVVLLFHGRGWAHAVVAVKYEKGSYEGNKYNERIQYYDSNRPHDKHRYVYVNSQSGAWCVKNYGIYSSFFSAEDNGGQLGQLGYIDELSIMNVKDIDTAIENYKAILKARGKTEQYKDASIKNRDKTVSVATIIDGRSDLSYWYDLTGGSDSPLNIALPDNKEDYSVSSPDAYDYSLKYPDAFLLVQSAGAESASFERGGTVKLAHNTGSYKLTSTLDSATGDLYTFGVTGTDGGDVELRKTEGGYVIKADSLKGATAEASGDDVTKSIALDGDATEVQISSDGTDITASIDEDGDGIFEKAIGSSAQGAKQGKDDNKQNKGDDGTPGPTDHGSKVSSTFNGNAGSARVSDVQPERGGGDLPKTGDSSPLFVALPLAVLGALATVLGIVLRRRRGDADSGGVDG